MLLLPDVFKPAVLGRQSTALPITSMLSFAISCELIARQSRGFTLPFLYAVYQALTKGHKQPAFLRWEIGHVAGIDLIGLFDDKLPAQVIGGNRLIML